MYVELLVKPGTDIVQFWPVPGCDAVALLRRGSSITVVFTTPSEARVSLNLAERLTGLQKFPLLLVCPVAPGVLGQSRNGASI